MKTWQDRVNGMKNWSNDEKKLFFEFARKAQTKRKPAGDRRIEKYRTDLIIAQSMAKMSLSEMIKDLKGLESAILKINSNKKYVFYTKRDSKRTLGSFYNFKHNGDISLSYATRELKELIAHDAKASDKRIAKEVITRQEMQEMLKYANTQDKAIICLLFESGARMGEFVQLKKSDIKQVDEGLLVRIPPGKTGERQVIVVEATKHVNRWLDEHPIRKKDAPLWVSTSMKEQYKSAAITKRIRLVVEQMNMHKKKQGLPLFTKPVNPHNFRHSRASELGGESGMTEQILCKYFGWELDSDMPKTYLHLTDEQVKKAVLRTYGKSKKEEEKKIETHKTCSKCQEENPLSLNYCGKCGQPLDSNKQITRIGQLEEELKELKKLVVKQFKQKVAKKVVKRKQKDK